MLVMLRFSLFTLALPRALPQPQAAHFCRLLTSDGQGAVYPLSLYARHLTTMLCGAPSYGGYTAEQVFTGIVFFYSDWEQLPLIALSDHERRTLVDELHSGATLRLFPHKTSDGTVEWYAPTDRLPLELDAEHRRYIAEVLTRLSAEVQAGEWPTVDAYIDRMLEYQCRYGGTALPPLPPRHLIPIVLQSLAAVVLVVILLRRRKT